MSVSVGIPDRVARSDEAKEGQLAKVLGVIGSPRRGANTETLVRQVLEGAEAEGAVTEPVQLAELRIRACDGCHVCWSGRPCCKDDDMIDLYDAIAESDALVFGTPVYWYGPTAAMKGFIDRFVYFNCPENRARIRGKRACITVPFEEEILDAADLVERFFERSLEYLEVNYVGSVLAPGMGTRGAAAKNAALLQAAYDLGRELVRDLT